MMRYMVVVERGATSWGAHVPDLPGCVAVGETRVEVLQLIREAIEFHIAGLKQDGLPVPGQAPRVRSSRWGPPNFSMQPPALRAAADAARYATPARLWLGWSTSLVRIPSRASMSIQGVDAEQVDSTTHQVADPRLRHT